jgi:cyanuric acid amidohydrolase
LRETEHTGLLASVGRTRALEPHEIGSAEHARQVSKTVITMVKELNVPLDLVKLVLVKCPLLTSAKLESIKAAGKIPITSDTYESMAKSRHASAIGIAMALNEINEGDLETEISSPQSWSAKASCSSGAELEDCHILLLANSPTVGPLRALSGYMKDAIDLKAIMKLLGHVQAESGKVVQIFAKAEADPTGLIRGKRHTMNTDSDIHGTRHARAAVGGLIAGMTGDTEVYVSGGAEGQGPIGGGSMCIVYRCGEP